MSTTRSRTKEGKYRVVRGDTRVRTIEKKYNVDLDVRSDMKFENYLKKRGYPSLSRMLKDKK